MPISPQILYTHNLYTHNHTGVKTQYTCHSSISGLGHEHTYLNTPKERYSNVTAGLLTTANALPLTRKTAMTNATSVPNTNFCTTLYTHVKSEQSHISSKEMNVSVGASGTGTVLLRTTQNGGIVANNIHNASTPNVTGVANSAIYNLASVAAEQKPLTVTTANNAAGISGLISGLNHT